MNSLNNQSDAQTNAMRGLYDTLETFYGMDDVAVSIQTLTDLLSVFFASNPSGQSRFRDYTDKGIDDMVFNTGTIITFLSKLKEDFGRAKEYFPQHHQEEEYDECA